MSNLLLCVQDVLDTCKLDAYGSDPTSWSVENGAHLAPFKMRLSLHRSVLCVFSCTLSLVRVIVMNLISLKLWNLAVEGATE